MNEVEWVAVAADYPIAHAYLIVTRRDADLPPGFLVRSSLCGLQRPEGPVVSVLWNICPICTAAARGMW